MSRARTSSGIFANLTAATSARPPHPRRRSGHRLGHRAIRAAIEALEVRRLLAAITVTTSNDDLTPGDGSVSLREAITAINAGNDLGDTDITAENPGTFGTNDTIKFAIPGSLTQLISPSAPLPAITKTVSIDGTTQPGFSGTPLIFLNGVFAGDAGVGLTVSGAAASGSVVRGLDVVNWGSDGIDVKGASNVVIAGNYVGTNGSISLTNNRVTNGITTAGVNILGGSVGTRVGGTTAADRNVIFDDNTGVGSSGAGITGSLIEGNFIGVDAAGSAAVGLAGTGIILQNATSTTIGGTAPGAGNVISGAVTGINVNFGANQTTMKGNLIGTDATGLLAIGNQNGIVVTENSQALIGGPTAAARNVISANILIGIALVEDAVGATIQGNFIGTNAAGTAALGNAEVGVEIDIRTFSTTVGGLAPGDGNLISGNGVGIGIENASSSRIEGNLIGTDVTGAAPLGNRDAGISFVSIAPMVNLTQNNLVGGSIPAAGNVIAFNGGNGVEVLGPDVTLNAIRLNSIHDNGGLGIDLSAANVPDGVTPNDPGDGDTGGNDLQNFPVLASAVSTTAGGGSTTIIGNFNSAANTNYLLDFYANDAVDPSGSGEGQTYLGTLPVTTDASGNVTFSEVIPAALAAGKFVVATATTAGTAPFGDTSEFSPDVQVSSAGSGPGTTPSDQPLAAAGVPFISATEGTQFSGLLAKFSDADAGATAADFSATIDWGDGIMSTGTIAADPAGGFDVNGTHTYAEEGTDPIAISIKDNAGRNDTGGSTAMASSSAHVADPVVVATGGFAFTAVEGAASSAQTVATFTDPGGPEAPADYSATINWGDGISSVGTIALAAGTFSVTGSHTYVEESASEHANSNPYTITVTIDHDATTPQVVTSSAHVSDPSVVASSAGTPVSIRAGGNTGALTLATFTDPGGPEATTDYSATINWGDGSTTAGTISASGQTFTVSSAGHTYAHTGTFSPVVTIHHESSATTSVTDANLVTVHGGAVLAAGVNFSGQEGRTFSGKVATFTDTDTTAPTSQFIATIKWGDGHTTTGTVVRDSAGHFHVNGSHAYAEENTDGYKVSIAIQDTMGTSATASALGKIADSPLDHASGQTLTVKANTAFSGKVLGSFRDQDALNTVAADYIGTINWGDGTTSAASFLFTGATANSGSFWNVLGSHKYTAKKTYTVTISLRDGASATFLTITSHMTAV